jgi:GGDEF domain-containing protein
MTGIYEAALGIVALVAVRWGARAGIVLGFVAAGLWYGASEAKLVPGTPVQCFALAVIGSALGALRERQVRREELTRSVAADVRSERDALRTRLAIAEQARKELERRVVEPGAAMALLQDAAAKLEVLDDVALFPAIVDAVGRHLHAEACAVYAIEGGRLKRKAFRGGDAPPEDMDPGEGLMGTALREKRVVSVREVTAEGSGDRRLDALLAAPLLASDGTPLGAIRVGSMPFISLTESAVRLLGLLAKWASGPAERVLYAKPVPDKTIFDESIGALRYSYFVDQLASEFERSRRYQMPLTVLIVEVLAWAEVPPANRETLRRALAQSLKNTLRTVDGIFLFKEDRSFVVTLPHTGPDGAERARERIVADIEKLNLEPYRPARRLELAIGHACQTAEMWSPADLTAAAETHLGARVGKT